MTHTVQVQEQSREWCVFEGHRVPRSARGFFGDLESSGDFPAFFGVEIAAYVDTDGLLKVGGAQFSGEGLTDPDLAKIPLGTFARKLYEVWTTNPDFEVGKPQLQVGTPGEGWSAGIAKSSKEAELREVARVYLMDPRRGTQNVMDLLGYRSKTTAIRRVMEARQKEFIPQVGASPTEYQAAAKRLEIPQGS